MVDNKKLEKLNHQLQGKLKGQTIAKLNYPTDKGENGGVCQLFNGVDELLGFLPFIYSFPDHALKGHHCKAFTPSTFLQNLRRLQFGITSI
jgi:hypothetical protein